MSDLISKRALEDAMYHEAFETDTDMQRWDSGCWIRYKLFENVIENLPAAQPERKKGMWIDEKGEPVGWHKLFKSCPAAWCKCSECGDWLEASDEYHVKGNFCPNCGAMMKDGD